VLDRCIKAHTNTKPFIKAREVCEKENAALVKIDSYEMWIFVTTVVGMLSSAVLPHGHAGQLPGAPIA
jgi:hypothetical protein